MSWTRRARRWFVDRRFTLATGLAAALPIVVATVRAVVDGWVPLGDDALIAVRSYEVLTAHPPLLGMPSTGPTGVLDEQTFHLGPLLFWVLALPAHFLGPSSLAVTAGLVNAACVMGSVALAHRRGGRPLMFATAIAVPVMLASLPAENYSDVWNPAVAVLPFTLLLFLAWSLACGEYRLLPLTVLVASFVVQCHLIFLVPALGAVAVGLAGLVVMRPRPRRQEVRGWAVAAVAVGLVCWSGPLIDQAVNRPGNLVQLARAAQSDDPTLGPGIGARAVVRATGVPPWWLRRPRGALERIADLDTSPGPVAIVASMLVLAGLIGLTVAGWRRRRRDVVAAGMLGVAICAAIALATASVPSASYASTGYGLWWASAAGMWIWLAIGWSAAVLVAPARDALVRRPALLLAAGLGAAAAAGTAVAAASDPPDEPFAQLRTVTERLQAELPDGAPVRVEGTWSSETVFLAGGFQLGIVYALLREGRTVTAPSLTDLGSRYGTDDEDGPVARVRVDVDPQAVERGRRIARLRVPSADPNNPFSTAPASRMVAVTLLPSTALR
ncbi:MAG TPA: hypothetical protein VGW14_02565 [Thermoleophilaceae bacterium]|nr:hypothetical protein [Thermoleophilaceae bacterium]